MAGRQGRNGWIAKVEGGLGEDRRKIGGRYFGEIMVL